MFISWVNLWSYYFWKENISNRIEFDEVSHIWGNMVAMMMVIPMTVAAVYGCISLHSTRKGEDMVGRRFYNWFYEKYDFSLHNTFWQKKRIDKGKR